VTRVLATEFLATEFTENSEKIRQGGLHAGVDVACTTWPPCSRSTTPRKVDLSAISVLLSHGICAGRKHFYAARAASCLVLASWPFAAARHRVAVGVQPWHARRQSPDARATQSRPGDLHQNSVSNVFVNWVAGAARAKTSVAKPNDLAAGRRRNLALIRGIATIAAKVLAPF